MAKKSKSEIMQLDAGALQKAEWLKKNERLLGEIRAIDSINSDEEFKVSGKLQTESGKHIKVLNKIRMDFKRPITKWIKENIDDKAKEMLEDIEAENARIKSLNGDFATKKANEAEQKRREIAEAAVDAAMKGPKTFGGLIIDDAPAQIPQDKVKTGTNAQVVVHDIDIINQQLIPREFLSVDMAKLKEYAKCMVKLEQTPEVAGVRFTKRIDVRGR